MCIFDRVSAVVIQRGSPQHRTVSHHTARCFLILVGVTLAAGLADNAEISRVYEPHKLAALSCDQRVCPFRIAARTIAVTLTSPFFRKFRLHVSSILSRRGRITAVTRRAGQPLCIFAFVKRVEYIAFGIVTVHRLYVFVTSRTALDFDIVGFWSRCNCLRCYCGRLYLRFYG